VGLHPESGIPIKAGFGRFGPYIQHDGKYASLGAPEEVFEIGLNRAVSLLAEKAASARGRRGANVIKELGAHPELGGKVQVLTGRYGPYVKHGKINATLPRDSEPEQVTLEEAVALIAAKSGKGPGKNKRSAKTAPAKKPARKAGKSNKEAVEETAG
jgi:DNA topoisomerase-1